MTQCAKIIVGFMANVGNVFIKRLQTFFFNFSAFLRFFKFLFERNYYTYEGAGFNSELGASVARVRSPKGRDMDI